jgi:hypothetical protein
MLTSSQLRERFLRTASVRFAIWLAGTFSIFAVTTCLSYRLSADQAATGLPIPYSAWERNESGESVDFVGWLTPIALLIDLCIALSLTIWLWRLIDPIRRSMNASSD